MNTIRTTLVVAAALTLAACDFKVTNPGPVADGVLDDPGAFDAIVRGVRYNISRGTSNNSYYAAIGAKEYSTGGRVIGTKLPLNFGQLTVDDMSANGYNWSQTARWTAEDGIRRLRAVLGDAAFATSRHAGQLLMYAALANRMLGECYCEAVIDGGAAQPHTVYLQRAEAHATEAIAVASAAGDTPTRQAAYGIRASVRMYLGNFAGAAADAAPANVPNSFSLMAPYDLGTQNILVQSNDFAVGGSFRATTTWRAFSESYFRTTGDLRVRWDSQVVGTAPNTSARTAEFTGIPWFFQRKYVPTLAEADRASPIRLVSGREMRLIEAEVALRNNDLPTAMGLINGLRAGQAVRAGSPALSPWPATTINEGWDALKKERYIELWLEGRTMGDLRRWVADGTYPAMFTIEPDRGTVVRSGQTLGLGSENDIADRIRLCFPIPRGERNTNANLSITPNDPVSPIFNNTVAPW